MQDPKVLQEDLANLVPASAGNFRICSGENGG